MEFLRAKLIQRTLIRTRITHMGCRSGLEVTQGNDTRGGIEGFVHLPIFSSAMCPHLVYPQRDWLNTREICSPRGVGPRSGRLSDQHGEVGTPASGVGVGRPRGVRQRVLSFTCALFRTSVSRPQYKNITKFRIFFGAFKSKNGLQPAEPNPSPCKRIPSCC